MTSSSSSGADLQDGREALDAFAGRIEAGLSVELPGHPGVVVSVSVIAAFEQVLACADAAM